MLNKITQGDSIEVMRKLADKSVDMILCDLPYGTTRNKWDSIIPLEPLWAEYERIIKDRGAIVLTASQPFTTELISSNRKLFKYEWIWQKDNGSGFLNAKRMPMKSHENVCIFYKKSPVYNPQMEKRDKPVRAKMGKQSSNFGNVKNPIDHMLEYKYPKSIVKFSNSFQGGKEHPTQKPVPLFEYLIRTYSNQGDIILDNCIGSGTTAIAAINTGRQFIGIERETEYCEIARQRIADALQTEVDGK